MHIESIMSECKNNNIVYAEGKVNVYVYIIRLCMKLQMPTQYKPRAQHRDQIIIFDVDTNFIMAIAIAYAIA